MIEVVKLRIDIEGKPVHRYPTTEVYTDRTDLSGLNGRLITIHPNTCVPVISDAFDMVVCQYPDDDFLQASDVPVDIRKDQIEVEDRISHQLSRSVEGDVATAIDFEILNLMIVESNLVKLEMVFASTLSKRKYRGMLAQQEVMVLGYRVPGPFILNEILVETGLDVPGFFIRDQAKVNDLNCLFRIDCHATKIRYLLR